MFQLQVCGALTQSEVPSESNRWASGSMPTFKKGHIYVCFVVAPTTV